MDTDKRKLRGVVAISALLIAASGAFFYYTFTFQTPFGALGSDYGPAFFPRIMLGVIVASSLGLIVQTLLRRRPAGPSEGLALRAPQLLRVAVLWFLCAGFYWAWRHFDFLYVSVAFAVAVALLLGVRRIVSLVLLGAVGPLLYFVFQQVLGVRL